MHPEPQHLPRNSCSEADGKETNPWSSPPPPTTMVATKTLSALALAAILDVTYGTAAPNFPIPGGPADLTVAFGSNTVSPPGELIPRAGTHPISLPLHSASNSIQTH